MSEEWFKELEAKSAEERKREEALMQHGGRWIVHWVDNPIGQRVMSFEHAKSVRDYILELEARIERLEHVLRAGDYVDKRDYLHMRGERDALKEDNTALREQLVSEREQ
jgi:hypothetical protein